jgi:hypothetical protein
MQRTVAPFGVQILGELNEGQALHAVIDSGAHWIRVGVEWRTLAPQDVPVAQYQWSAYDATLRNIGVNGLRAIAVLGGNPTWAADFSRGPVHKVSWARWAEYIRAVVQRYRVEPYNVKHWEIYNEPDAADWFDSQGNRRAAYGDRPEEYIHALKVAHETIKALDPQAIVIFGGIAYDAFTDDPSPGFFTRSFLERVLDGGASQYFDWMNFHYYPTFEWRWSFPQKVQALKQLLQRRGLKQPLICTEIGFSSEPAHGGSAQAQAAKVVQLFTRGIAEQLDVMIWYTLADYGNLNDFYSFFGLLDVYGKPKSSWTAFRVMSRQLTGWRFIERLGVAPPALEGYVFANATGQRQYVIWSNDNHAYPMTLQNMLEVTTLAGERSFQGRQGSSVNVTIGGVPIFIREVPPVTPTPTATPKPTATMAPTSTPSPSPTSSPTLTSTPTPTTTSTLPPPPIPSPTTTPTMLAVTQAVASSVPVTPASTNPGVTRTDSGLNYVLILCVGLLMIGGVGYLWKHKWSRSS